MITVTKSSNASSFALLQFSPPASTLGDMLCAGYRHSGRTGRAFRARPAQAGTKQAENEESMSSSPGGAPFGSGGVPVRTVRNVVLGH